MKTSLITLLLLNINSIKSQQIQEIVNAAQNVIPSNYHETVSEAIKPVKEALEPFHVHSTTVERGTPKLHEPYGKFRNIHLRYSNLFCFNLDCEKKPNDPQCSHELKDSAI